MTTQQKQIAELLTQHEAEAGLIACLISFPFLAAEVRDKIPADSFTHRAHRVIYAAMLATAANGEKIDLRTLWQRLEASGTADMHECSRKLYELSVKRYETKHACFFTHRLRCDCRPHSSPP